jgi:hypothetical protein
MFVCFSVFSSEYKLSSLAKNVQIHKIWAISYGLVNGMQAFSLLKNRKISIFTFPTSSSLESHIRHNKFYIFVVFV